MYGMSEKSIPKVDKQNVYKGVSSEEKSVILSEMNGCWENYNKIMQNH